jgi:hypothetical protein
MSQNISKTTTRKENSGCICHWCIVLFITAGRMVELEIVPEIQLILLHTEVNRVNLLLHGRDGLLDG